MINHYKKFIIVGLISLLLVLIQKDYVVDFILNQLPAIFITIIGFSQAGIMFLIGSLSNYEDRKGKKLFKDTRKELKDAIKFQLYAFIISLIASVIISRCLCQDINSILSVIIISLFLLSIYSLYLVVMTGIDFTEGKETVNTKD